MMDTAEGVRLAYGYSPGVPEGVKTAWGARLIAPNDLVWDRQDLVAENDEAKAKLIAWLNGSPEGTGAILQMRERLLELRYDLRGDKEVVLIDDEHGRIVGNERNSGGYVYVAGWLK